MVLIPKLLASIGQRIHSLSTRAAAMIEPMLWFFALIGMLFCLYHAGKLACSLSCRLQAWASQVRVISIRRLRSSPSLIAFARAAELDYVRQL